MSLIVNLLGPVWTVRLINTYFFCRNALNTVKNVSVNVATTVQQYLDGTNNRWVFLKDGAGPIPASMVSNYFTSRIVSWVYDSRSNTLYSTNPVYIPEFGDPVNQSVPVLSSSIRIHGTSHDMDTFMNSFTFIAPRRIVPSPRLLMYCWSVYTAKWGIPEDHPVFEFIDMDGNDMRYSIFNRDDTDRDDWDRLFNMNDDSEEDSSEEDADDADSEDNSDEGTEDDNADDGEGDDADDEADDEEGDGDDTNDANNDEDGVNDQDDNDDATDEDGVNDQDVNDDVTDEVSDNDGDGDDERGVPSMQG
jgi:hypothetical protein